MEYFKSFNKQYITISADKKRILSNHGCYGSAYGVFVIENDFNGKTATKWTFKIHSLNDTYSSCIGIDSLKNINDDAFRFHGSIGYRSNGNVYHNGKFLEKYDNGYEKDDIITMIHNPRDKTITFWRQYGSHKMKKAWYGGNSNEVEIRKGTIQTFNPIKMNNDDKKYKMCVMLWGEDSSIELLSCEQCVADDQQNENKEQAINDDKDLAVNEGNPQNYIETDDVHLLKQIIKEQRLRIITLERDNETLIEQNTALKVNFYV